MKGIIMKRMHIHVGVEKLDDSIKFYNALFGAQPVKTKDDYAKWMLDDPRINFAVSTRARSGVDHLGIQVDNDHELEAFRERLKNADISLFNEGETVCCYARSDKSWVSDPAGIAWEAYKSMQNMQIFSDANASEQEECCTPATQGQPDCCVPSDKTAGCCG